MSLLFKDEEGYRLLKEAEARIESLLKENEELKIKVKTLEAIAWATSTPTARGITKIPPPPPGVRSWYDASTDKMYLQIDTLGTTESFDVKLIKDL